MKTLPILLISLSLLPLSQPLRAAEEKPAKKPAKEKKEPAKKPAGDTEKPETAPDAGLSKAQAVLKEAFENHNRLLGFHVDVEVKTPGGKATMSGEIGQGSLSLLCTSPKGEKKKRVVAGGEFYLSTDDGKTWLRGDAADKEATLICNNIITAPDKLQEEILKGQFTVKEEKLHGEDVLHLEKPARDKEAAVHFWLCREPEMKNMVFLRKVELIISGSDMELPATITYSKLTVPVTIKAPDVK